MNHFLKKNMIAISALDLITLAFNRYEKNSDQS